MGKQDVRNRANIQILRQKAGAIELQKRIARRECGPCTGCDATVKCGWRQGLFLDGQRPDLLGLRMAGTRLQRKDGAPGDLLVWVFYELREDASKEPDAAALVTQAVQRGGKVVLVADVQEQWRWIGGPSVLIQAIIGRDERLSMDGRIVSMDLHKVEANAEENA